MHLYLKLAFVWLTDWSKVTNLLRKQSQIHYRKALVTYFTIANREINAIPERNIVEPSCLSFFWPEVLNSDNIWLATTQFKHISFIYNSYTCSLHIIFITRPGHTWFSVQVELRVGFVCLTRRTVAGQTWALCLRHGWTVWGKFWADLRVSETNTNKYFERKRNIENSGAGS